MRKLTLVCSLFTVAAVAWAFVPAFSNASSDLIANGLASVSTYDLTVASGPLATAPTVEAH
jgi:hypothetical protein